MDALCILGFVLTVLLNFILLFTDAYLRFALDYGSFLHGMGSLILHTEFLRSGNHGRE